MLVVVSLSTCRCRKATFRSMLVDGLQIMELANVHLHGNFKFSITLLCSVYFILDLVFTLKHSMWDHKSPYVMCTRVFSFSHVALYVVVTFPFYCKG